MFQRDEIRILAVAFGLDRVNRQIATVDFQVTQYQMAHVDQADGVGARPRDEARWRGGVGRFDDNGLIELPRQMMQRQPLAIFARLEQPAIPRLQAAQIIAVILRIHAVVCGHRHVRQQAE